MKLKNNKIRIVAISDSHGLHSKLKLPEGDILIHSGDMLNHGVIDELVDFTAWINKQPFKHKICVAGNHDRVFQHNPDLARTLLTEKGVIYLQDELVEIEGLRIYGTPYTPTFGYWSFMASERDLKYHYHTIPENLDILISHGPPHMVLDIVPRGVHAGSTAMKEALAKLEDPPMHSVFGHLHTSGGKSIKIGDTTYHNAAICTEEYKPLNPIITFDI